jgi:hypothetical protein
MFNFQFVESLGIEPNAHRESIEHFAISLAG